MNCHTKIIETERLTLRPWEESDAESLYEYAKNPNVGPIAGWPVHTSVENSRQVIKDVLSKEYTYAITLKKQDKAIGCIGLMLGKNSNFNLPDGEAEIGYWIGEPYWGNGYVPEATAELMKFGFEKLKLHKLWCGYFDGNYKSKRVQEKCGFRYHHTNKDVKLEMMNDTKTEHINCISYDEWKCKWEKQDLNTKI